MSEMKGPAILLAQFTGADAPFDSLANITQWAGELGYKGVQIPSWEAGLIDLPLAASFRSSSDCWPQMFQTYSAVVESSLCEIGFRS